MPSNTTKLSSLPRPVTGPGAWYGAELSRSDDWVVHLGDADIAIHLQMAFRPSDMQFLHNHQILHSRNDFENWPEPARHRHLLRLWMAPIEGRPLPPVFAPRYGSITPGERRHRRPGHYAVGFARRMNSVEARMEN